MNLDSKRFELGLAFIVLGVVVCAAAILLALSTQPGSKCILPYPALGFLTMVILSAAGVTLIVSSRPSKKGP